MQRKHASSIFIAVYILPLPALGNHWTIASSIEMQTREFNKSFFICIRGSTNVSRFPVVGKQPLQRLIKRIIDHGWHLTCHRLSYTHIKDKQWRIYIPDRSLFTALTLICTTEAGRRPTGGTISSCVVWHLSHHRYLHPTTITSCNPTFYIPWIALGRGSLK